MSGVNWRFAKQGKQEPSNSIVGNCKVIRNRTMHGTAKHQSKYNSTSDNTDASYVRQMYIQGLSFLLRGLPQDMTVDEQILVKGALPHQVLQPLQITKIDDSSPEQVPLLESRSLLQRALSSSIVQGYVVARAIVPRVASISTKVYKFEQDHKIKTNAAVSDVIMANQMDRSGLVLGGKLLQLADALAGGIAKSAALWCVHGVAGEVQDGVCQISRLSATGK